MISRATCCSILNIKELLLGYIILQGAYTQDGFIERPLLLFFVKIKMLYINTNRNSLRFINTQSIQIRKMFQQNPGCRRSGMVRRNLGSMDSRALGIPAIWVQAVHAGISIAEESY